MATASSAHPAAKSPASCYRFLLAFDQPKRRRHQRQRPPDGLHTASEAAAKLGCSIKTLNGHVAARAIKYVTIGHGRKRPRKMFTDADLDTVHCQPNPRGPAVSIRRDPRSPFWQYNFQIRGYRFFGSTKCTTRREAEKVEAAEREKAKKLVAQTAAAKTSLRLDDVFGRYWTEVGQHLEDADDNEHRLELLLKRFGPDKLIIDIDDNDVIGLVAWRRGHLGKQGKPLSPFTVNATTMQLRKLFTRCKLWGVRFEHEPLWKRHWLAVPDERVREVSEDEADRIEVAISENYRPFVEFARVSGWRLSECLLKWSEIDWGARQITKLGKGNRRVTTTITPTMREILWPLRGHHPIYVFTPCCEG